MPLKLTQRGQIWWVRGTVRGQGIYESTGTGDRTRAEGYRAKREAEAWDSSVYGARAVVTFAAAAESYLSIEDRSPFTRKLVGNLLEHFQTAPLRAIDQEAVDRAYKVILTAQAGNATKLRIVLTPLRAILEHAARRQWCDRPAFETPRQPRVKTPVLMPDQATALVQAAAPHLRPLLVFLIGTGARLSEALELEWPEVDLVGARATLRQKQGTDRHAELPPVAIAALSALTWREGRVFRPARHNARILGEAYRDTGRSGGGQIKTAWARACQVAGLPGEEREWERPDRPGVWKRFAPEFTPHDCRHTWASWHYCLHRDLLRLRDDGGWDTVSMVERYAKRVPEIYREQILAWWAGTPATVARANSQGLAG